MAEVHRKVLVAETAVVMPDCPSLADGGFCWSDEINGLSICDLAKIIGSIETGGAAVLSTNLTVHVGQKSAAIRQGLKGFDGTSGVSTSTSNRGVVLATMAPINTLLLPTGGFLTYGLLAEHYNPGEGFMLVVVNRTGAALGAAGNNFVVTGYGPEIQ